MACDRIYVILVLGIIILASEFLTFTIVKEATSFICCPPYLIIFKNI